MSVGATIGEHYRIVGEIGGGAMGDVYKAVDTKLFDRPVAIKILTETLSRNEQGRARFRREIEVAARLAHPHIVMIYDWGEHEGRNYYVMEYIAGSDLGRLMGQRPPWNLEHKIEIALQICDALEFAHESNVIHRDVKPANIMIMERPGGPPFAKLVDFGIAHVEHSRLTRSESQPGTFRYMSPEQLHNLPLDRRTDLFSLGIVLYELFGGSYPFLASSDVAVLDKIRFEEPPPLREKDRRIPPELEALVLRLLAKEVGQRPASAKETAESLRQILRKFQTRSEFLSVQFQQVEEALDDGRLDEARALVVDVLRRLPTESRAAATLERLLVISELRIPPDVFREYRRLLRDARRAMQEGGVQEARDACAKAEKLWPNDVEAVGVREEIERRVNSEALLLAQRAAILLREARQLERGGREALDRAEQALPLLEQAARLGGTSGISQEQIEDARRLRDDLRAALESRVQSLADQAARLLREARDLERGSSEAVDRAQEALLLLEQAAQLGGTPGISPAQIDEARRLRDDLRAAVQSKAQSLAGQAASLFREARELERGSREAVERAEQALPLLEQAAKLGGTPGIAQEQIEDARRLRDDLRAALQWKVKSLADQAASLLREARELERGSREAVDRAQEALLLLEQAAQLGGTPGVSPAQIDEARRLRKELETARDDRARKKRQAQEERDRHDKAVASALERAKRSLAAAPQVALSSRKSIEKRIAALEQAHDELGLVLELEPGHAEALDHRRKIDAELEVLRGKLAELNVPKSALKPVPPAPVAPHKLEPARPAPEPRPTEKAPAPKPRPRIVRWTVITAAGLVLAGAAAVAVYKYMQPKPEGSVAINVLPWGEIVEIVETKTSKQVAMGPGRATPLVLTLPAGEYQATIKNPDSKESVEISFRVIPNRLVTETRALPGFDRDTIIQEIEDAGRATASRVRR